MNTTSAKVRDVLATRIVKAIVRNRLSEFIPKQPDGVRHFVTAPEDDTIGDMSARINAAGGNATMFVLRANGSRQVFTVTQLNTDAPTGSDVHEVRGVITIGRFEEHLTTQQEPTPVAVTSNSSVSYISECLGERLVLV